MGTWREDTQTGFGLEIDTTGTLTFRCGAGPGRVATISTQRPLTARRWYFVAASFQFAQRGTMTIRQQPVPRHLFHGETDATATTTTSLRPAAPAVR